MSVQNALKTENNSSLVDAINAEIKKVTTIYKVIRPINPNDIKDDANRTYSNMFIKLKLDGRITVRLAAGGDRQTDT